jgi:hypothetical protein
MTGKRNNKHYWIKYSNIFFKCIYSSIVFEISFIPLNSGNFVHEQPLDGQFNCWAGSLIVLYQMTIFLSDIFMIDS